MYVPHLRTDYQAFTRSLERGLRNPATHNSEPSCGWPGPVKDDMEVMRTLSLPLQPYCWRSTKRVAVMVDFCLSLTCVNIGGRADTGPGCMFNPAPSHPALQSPDLCWRCLQQGSGDEDLPQNTTKNADEPDETLSGGDHRATNSRAIRACRLKNTKQQVVNVISEDDEEGEAANTTTKPAGHKGKTRRTTPPNGASGAQGPETALAAKPKSTKKDSSVGHSRHKTGTYCPDFNSTEMKFGETGRWTGKPCADPPPCRFICESKCTVTHD